MARGYNKVILIGNVARDPDIRVTPTTTMKVARFTLAVNREWKDKTTGEKKSEADFISCQAWQGKADVIEKFVRKGKQLMVEGRISVRKYQDKNGVDKWDTSVICDEVILLGSKDGDVAPSGQWGSNPSARQYDDDATPYRQQGDEPDYPLDISKLGDEDAEVPF